jgi:hypothetical protein
MNVSYPANWSDDVVQRAQRGGQGVDHGPNSYVDAATLLLYGVIKGEDRLL